MGLIAPNKANTPVAKKTYDKSSMKNRALDMLASYSVDAEGVERREIDQILARALNTAKYAKSDKDATSAGKWLWEIAFGKSPVAVEEKDEELPEVTFRIKAKDKKLLEDISQRDDIEEEPSDKIVIDIEGEPTMEFD